MPLPIRDAIVELQRLYPAAPATGKGPLAALAGFVVGTALLALLFWILERLWPENPAQRQLRKARGTDVAFWVIDSVVARVAVLGSVLAGIVLLLLRLPHGHAVVGRQPGLLQVIEMLILADLTSYWIHRAMHSVPRLWRIHAVHHSSEQLDWLAAGRVHPLETLISRTLVTVPIFLAGFPPRAMAAFVPVLGLYPIFLHANVRWGFGRAGRWIASPAFHRWHHSADPEARDRNFAGIFPFWDRLFGTLHLPAARRPQRYGLLNGQFIASRLGALLRYPFAWGSFSAGKPDRASPTASLCSH
jgi:sterol desaturase/sphingolipid hydroxylase (fatty acid hydroxylase superfamily)